jgi:acid phosphatase (class A)
MRSKLFQLIFLSSAFIFSACLQEQQTSDLATLREISPGILEGYLTKDELPNSLKLLDPPPEEGSAAFNLDQEMAAKYLTVEEGRHEQAAKDAVLAFPEAADAFNMVLDVKISLENTPHLYILLRRTLADAGLSTYAAKNNYQRSRPFMINNERICTPEEEEHLRKDGSYPSGHTAIGWAWALILTEVFPEKTDVILERGKQFGISRNICNVHWHSDVIAGRMMGAVTVARLHANPVFLADLAVAKKEVTH